MEKSILDFGLNAFIAFHRSIGLLVMICLLLWMMSGRRLDSGAYMTTFTRLAHWLCKHFFRACEYGARGTAASVPLKHARWRPLVRIVAQLLYVVITVFIVVLAVSHCAQTGMGK